MKFFTPYFLLFLLVSCSSVHKAGLRMTGGIFDRAGEQMETTGNWEMFKNSVPGNLQLVEGLLAVDPKNKSLLRTLIKGYAGFAYVVNETYYLQDKTFDQNNSIHLEQALWNYSKALNFGKRYLATEGILLQDVLTQSRGGDLAKFLDGKLNDKEDLEAVFYLAQSWGAIINLQKQNLVLVSQVDIVKSLFDWACSKKPDFNFGACRIFYGAYDLGRPKMLGGNPDRGREILLDAINQYPQNYLMRVAYLEYYVVPNLDLKEYSKHKKAVKDFAVIFKQQMKVDPLKNADEVFNNRLNLFNSLAIKRMELMEVVEKKLFQN